MDSIWEKVKSTARGLLVLSPIILIIVGIFTITPWMVYVGLGISVLFLAYVIGSDLIG